MTSLITSDNIYYNKFVKKYAPIYDNLNCSSKKNAEKAISLAVKMGYQQACLDMRSKRIPNFRNKWYEEYDDSDDDDWYIKIKSNIIL